MSLLYGTQIASAPMASDWNERIDECADAILKRVEKETARRVLIPMTDGSHYGVDVIEGSGDGLICEGYNLWWGDSLGRPNFNGLRDVLIAVAGRIWPLKLLRLDTLNYMTKKLGCDEHATAGSAAPSP